MLIKTRSLTPKTRLVIEDKGTDLPNSGGYTSLDEPGTYLCRQCGLALFRAAAKFESHCGWPSFDEEIEGSVRMVPDSDGHRTEILCSRCGAHLGHVFFGEGFTKKNVRHCVNTSSLDFSTDRQVIDTEEGVFAGGCFWGVEHLFLKLPGVVLTECGYSGGHILDPTYEEVCEGKTGHVEAVRVVFDVDRLTFEDVARYFFEIHDPTQADGQGPDIGEQYKSIAFYYDDAQKTELEGLIKLLVSRGFSVKTQIRPVETFWPAEVYHQHYYEKTNKAPYCHRYVKRWS